VGCVARASFWLPLTIVTLAAFGFGFLLADARAELFELRLREARLEAELASIRHEHAVLRQQRRRLLSDPAAIERVARERYGFAAPGEVSMPFERRQEPVAAAAPVPVPQDRWDRLLGRGGYPWAVPACAFVVSVVVLGALEALSLLDRSRAGTASPP